VSTLYGRGEYGRGFYGGKTMFLTPGGRGASVTVYKPDGTVRSVFQTGVGNLMSLEFSHDECGGKSFSLAFASWVNILKNDMVKITIMDSDDCFFTGVIRSVPIDGSTKMDWTYSGFGLNDYLSRKNTGDVTYAGTTIEIIVRALAAIIGANTPINYNAAKVSACIVPITSIKFHYATMKEALDQLKKLADSDGNTYLFGVDRDGDFFFRPRTETLMATIIVGKKGRYGIDQYEPEDKTEYRTKLYALDKDGTYITTVTDLDPTLDLYEEKITAPEIAAADIPAWAAGVLAQKNRDTRQATISWRIWENNPLCLVADGSIRVISNVISPNPGSISGTAYGAGAYGSGAYGGGPVYSGKDLDDVLEVRDVSYKIAAAGSSRTINLGSLPANLPRSVAKLINHVKDMETSLGI
jgi:hypothetical protein